MYAVINVETGDFYSESPTLKKEVKRAGKRWDHSSILPAFARRYARHQDALLRSQKLSDSTDCICAVIPLA
ncbi:MAG: hypothetical protein WC208_14550 [Gallionella sp.]|jgi:hypothetical protein